MKKIFCIFLFSIFFWNSQTLSATKGKGEVKMSDRSLNHFKDYLSGKIVKGEKWKPSTFILSSNGRWSFYFYCPYTQGCLDSEAARKIKDCERDTGVHCGVFARRYTIYWDNGINTKTDKAKAKSSWSLSKLKSELTKLGFYDDGITSTGENTSIKEPKKIKKITDTDTDIDTDIVKKIKELNDLYKSGVLTKEEFEKAKAKLLN